MSKFMSILRIAVVDGVSEVSSEVLGTLHQQRVEHGKSHDASSRRAKWVRFCFKLNNAEMCTRMIISINIDRILYHQSSSRSQRID